MSEKIKAFISSSVDKKWKAVYKKSGIELTAIPLIALEFCGPEKLPDSDWIFISSQNGARFLWENYPEKLKSVNLAAVGNKTTEFLQKMGLNVLFSGNSSDTEVVSQAFLKVLKNESCLFPVSDKSSGKVYKAIPEPQRQVVTLYRTLEKAQSLPHFDIYMFTSAANVRAFLTKNTFHPTAKILAIGPSTALALDRYTVIQTRQSQIEELLEMGLL